MGILTNHPHPQPHLALAKKKKVPHPQFIASSFTLMPVKALDPLMASQYSESSTIEELLRHLMIEQLNSSIRYDNYYHRCQPMQCTYSVATRNDATYIATMSISVVVGLIAISNLIVPQLVRFIVYCIRKRGTGGISEMPIART